MIAGSAELVSRLRKNPIMRAVRVDKITYTALQIVLSAHLRGEPTDIVLWNLTLADPAEIRTRIEAFLQTYNLQTEAFTVVDSTATFGGGSTPGGQIPSAALRIEIDRSPDEIARFFQECEPSVVGTVKEGFFQIDFRTVLPEDETPLADACATLLRAG